MKKPYFAKRGINVGDNRAKAEALVSELWGIDPKEVVISTSTTESIMVTPPDDTNLEGWHGADKPWAICCDFLDGRVAVYLAPTFREALAKLGSSTTRAELRKHFPVKIAKVE